MMTTSGISERLASFPEEHTREFEEAAVNLANSTEDDVEPTLRGFLADTQWSENQRYAAFFTLATILRRRGHYSSLLSLLDEHASSFEHFGTFHHMKAMALTGRAEPHDLPLALASSDRARDLLPSHPGVLHSHATLRITELESRIPMSSVISESADQAIAEEVDGILSAVLLERPHYAKFHASLARLESLRGNHQDAQRFLSRAMELEDPASKDFNLRMVSYNQILSRIVMRESLSTVALETKEAAITAQQAQESVKSFVDQMQTRYLELLGIFAAIIGIVLTGVQVAAGMDFADGARLMLMVTGSILIVFSAITAVLQRPLGYMLTLASSGVFLIAGGFFAGMLP